MSLGSRAWREALGGVLVCGSLGACGLGGARLGLPANGPVDLEALAADLAYASVALGPEGMAEVQAQGFQLYWDSDRSGSAETTRAFGRWVVQAPPPGDEASGRLLAHELTHIALGVAGSTLPLWQEEGLAEFVSFRAAGSRAELANTLALLCGAGSHVDAVSFEPNASEPERKIIRALPNNLADLDLERFRAAWLELPGDPDEFTFRDDALEPNPQRGPAEYLAAFLAVSLIVEGADVPLDAAPRELAAVVRTREAPTRAAQIEHAWQLLLDLQSRAESDHLAEAEVSMRTGELQIGSHALGRLFADPRRNPPARTRFGRELLQLP